MPKKSHWSSDSLWRFVTTVFLLPVPPTVGTPLPADYRVILGPAAMDISENFWCGLEGMPYPLGYNFLSTPVNFTVKKRVNVTGDEAIDWVKIPFSFW